MITRFKIQNILAETTSFRVCKRMVNIDVVCADALNEDNQYFQLEDVVTPLSRIPYRRQLKIKYENLLGIQEKLYNYLNFKIDKATVYPVSPSPITEQYRNKDEFSFRVGVDGDPKTLGFFIGRPGKQNNTFCVRPTHLVNIKDRHKEIAKVYEDFVKKSPLPPCYDLNDGGYWRRLVIRSNENNDTMAICVVHPQNRTKDQLDDEGRQLAKHFEENNCHLTSLYHQACKHGRCTKENAPLVLVNGNEYIYEKLYDYNFRISPDAFFQINIPAAEVLFKDLFNLANLKDSSTILDLGCGTGVISILASEIVRNAIGIDESYSAIEDAVYNASINNRKNCEFLPGRVELVLKNVLAKLDSVASVTVFANPGRSGFHYRVIKLIRNSPQIRKLLYVSCQADHKGVLNNFLDLMDDDKNFTQPFKLLKIKGVDLFPHTNHLESIFLFVRK